MTKRWPDITLVCAHGITDGATDLVERFRHSASQDRWVPTIHGWDRMQQLQGDEPVTPVSHQPGGPAIRYKYSATCRCRRSFQRRDEVLQEQLYSAATLGVYTWRLDGMQRLGL